MDQYNLEAHIPYESPDNLFRGTEEGLKEFIRNNTRKVQEPWRTNKEKFYTVIKVCGHYLDDLSITITGPDVRDYIED